MSLSALFAEIVPQGGFLTDRTLPELVHLDRLRQVLVRCGACRFTCAAQDAAHLMAIIDRDDVDYVRDVALLAGDPAFSQAWPLPPEPKLGRTPFPAHCAYGDVYAPSDADPGL